MDTNDNDMKKVHSASLVVKLEGDNSVDAGTLINMLTQYMIITERANIIMGDGSYKTDVKIKALSKGSFEINFEVITSWIQNLITKENITFAAEVVGGIASVFNLYKHFKGNRVTKEEVTKQITIQNAEKIVNVYLDPTINESMRKVFETAMDDESIEGVTLIANNENTETVWAEEFGELVIPKDNIMPNERTVVVPSAQLNIIGLNFTKGGSWQFIYNGTKIRTKLSDEGLQKAIDQGASFAKGDSLRVELNITQRWNEEYNAYENKYYKIATVFEHISAPKQPQFFDDKIED